MNKLRPWLIAAWFVALYARNVYSVWSAAAFPYPTVDYGHIFLAALGLFTTPLELLLSALAILALSIKWKW